METNIHVTATEALVLITRAKAIVVNGDSSKEQLESAVSELSEVLEYVERAIGILQFEYKLSSLLLKTIVGDNPCACESCNSVE